MFGLYINGTRVSTHLFSGLLDCYCFKPKNLFVSFGFFVIYKVGALGIVYTQFKSIHIVTRPFKACMYIPAFLLSSSTPSLILSLYIFKMHFVAAQTTTSPVLMNSVFSHFGHHFHPEKRKKNLAARLLYYINTSDTLQHTHTQSRDNQAVAPPSLFFCV